MFFFIVNKIKNLFLYLYNNIESIKNGLYYPFVVGLLLAPGRWTFGFLASQLGLPWLVFIFAILLIVISLLLRSGLENKSPGITLKAFCIPLFIILFIWVMNYLNILGVDSALNASYLTVLLDWENTSYKIEEYLSPSVNNGQMATAGGANSKKIELEKGLKKLIPSSFLMEGGNSDRSAPDYLVPLDTRGDSGIQLPIIDTARQNVPGEITLPSTPPPSNYIVANNIIWNTIYTEALERNFRDKLIAQQDGIIEAYNTLSLHSRPGNEMHLTTMEFTNKALNHMAYLFYKSTGVTLRAEQVKELQNSFILRKILEIEIDKTNNYLNKLNHTNFQDYTSNPLFRELRVLENVLIDLHQRSVRYTVHRYTRDANIRQLMINAYQGDTNTSSNRPLNTVNSYLARTVIENRINVLKTQLRLVD